MAVGELVSFVLQGERDEKQRLLFGVVKEKI